ncbi:MAG: gliding motility-associated C-terminal domain-containing protein [Bacteroidia bacterium]|nr:gliding motility-associated C-terminal domain-containing protein [Bacteroidia bacterium]
MILLILYAVEATNSNAQILLTYDTIHPTCAGLANGSIDMTIVSDSGIASISWYYDTIFISNQEDLQNLVAGNYIVEVIDTTGDAVTDTVELTEPAVLTLSIAGTDVTCNGLGNGSANLTVSGGTTPYTYAWNTFETTEDIANLGPAWYYVTVTDDNGCVENDSIEITEPDSLTLSIAGTNTTCNGLANGSANISISGGTSPYNYLWNTGASTDTLQGISAGIFSVTVTDTNSCTITDTIEITELYHIITIDTISDAACYGTQGTFNITPQGGLGFYHGFWKRKIWHSSQNQWIIDTLWADTTETNHDTLNFLTSHITGFYILTITDTFGLSCAVTKNFELKQPSSPLTIEETHEHNICKYGNQGWINVMADGGTSPYSFLWSTGQNTSYINGLYAGSYNIIVSDYHNCSVIKTIDIEDPFQPLIIIADTQNVSCRDNYDGYVVINETENGLPPFTYLWSTGIMGNSITNLFKGIYSVTVTDANSCTAVDTFDIQLIDRDCITIYNVITPDGNGKNDTWKIENIHLYPECEVTVFDRWGKLVFSDTGYDNTWNGTSDGKNLNCSDYFYVVELNKGTYPVYTGPLKIIK